MKKTDRSSWWNMIRIRELKLGINHREEDLVKALEKKAQGQKLISYRLVRRSIDARKKPDLYWVYTLDAAFPDEKRLLRSKKSPWTRSPNVHYRFPSCQAQVSKEDRPVIVGMGPAGLFAGLLLAEAGLAPVIFERGEPVEERSITVDRFFSGGSLDPESNVQFGEGGAGTFSDGKLNTVVKDKTGRNRFVLEQFVKHGAPEEILYDARPHVGTDVLKKVVTSMRKQILACGGQIFFNTEVKELLLKETLSGDREIRGLLLEKKNILPADPVLEEYPCRHVILAAGHSARDTFAMLHQKNIIMTPKAFAIGVRVEHPARMINESQYGKGYDESLPAASYKLTHQCRNGRGIYSFCMCPGGYVVNSSSEKGRLCVNGMSYHGRTGRNSNSAIITTVTPADFPDSGPLGGVAFQRIYEEKAYQAAGGAIPVQLLEDFLHKRPSSGLGDIQPSIKGNFGLADLWTCLPDYICQSLCEGMEAFGRRIKGYDRPDTLLDGVETRTSSPVRIERDRFLQANVTGLYPCGEGAGYAGGITSAAMDGIRVAEAVCADLGNGLPE